MGRILQESSASVGNLGVRLTHCLRCLWCLHLRPGASNYGQDVPVAFPRHRGRERRNNVRVAQMHEYTQPQTVKVVCASDRSRILNQTVYVSVKKQIKFQIRSRYHELLDRLYREWAAEYMPEGCGPFRRLQYLHTSPPSSAYELSTVLLTP